MNCLFPPEIEAQKLLAYLDGEVDQEIKLHLGQCPYCFERAKALAHLQNRLVNRLYRSTCPSSLELGEYHLHMLPASQMLIVAQHLRECPHCVREVNELQNYLSELERSEATGMLGGIKVLIAHLVGEGLADGSSMLATPSVLRGARKGPITFEADGLVIILDIQVVLGGQVSILGQVAADDQDRWTGAVAELRQAETPPKNTSLDDLGSFRFEETLIGPTELTITSLYDVAIQIPKFDLVV